MKLAGLAVLAVAIALTWSASAGAANDQVRLRGYGTAQVDGVLTLNEWDGAGRFPFQVDTSPAGGGLVPATFYVMNDSRNVYFALRVSAPDLGNSAFDGIFLAPPPNVFGEGGDILHVSPTGLEDLFFHPVSPNYWDYQPDVTDGGTRDGTSVVGESGGDLMYEFSHPLDSADDLHDFSLGIPSHVAFHGAFQYCFGSCPASYIPETQGQIVIVSGTHVPPETRFTFGPADGAEVAAYGQFGFVGEDDVAPPSELTYECKIDDQDWKACESPVSRAATEDGWHRISVRAFDDMLNVDPTPATRHWRVDTEEPSKPKVVVASRPVASRTQLRISATDRGTPSWRIRFRCKVDAKPFQACASRYRVRLRSGRHVLRFSAIDLAGNRSPVKIVRLVVR
jgi:hypothetical protein